MSENKIKLTSSNLSSFSHVIDWDKVKTIEDVVAILKALNIQIDIDTCHPIIKKYLTPIKQ